MYAFVPYVYIIPVISSAKLYSSIVCKNPGEINAWQVMLGIATICQIDRVLFSAHQATWCITPEILAQPTRFDICSLMISIVVFTKYTI